MGITAIASVAAPSMPSIETSVDGSTAGRLRDAAYADFNLLRFPGKEPAMEKMRDLTCFSAPKVSQTFASTATRTAWLTSQICRTKFGARRPVERAPCC